MPERNYLQHGSRHRPEGTDPIEELAVASLRDLSAISVAGDNADHYLSLHDGITASFQTNDSDTFANASTTAFTGGAVYGLQILKAGLYRFEWDAKVASGGTAGAILRAYWSVSSPGSAFLSSFQQGRTQATVNDTWDLAQAGHISWTEYHSFDTDGVPAYAAPFAHLASGSSITLHVNLFATRVNSFFFDAI